MFAETVPNDMFWNFVRFPHIFVQTVTSAPYKKARLPRKIAKVVENKLEWVIEGCGHFLTTASGLTRTVMSHANTCTRPL